MSMRAVEHELASFWDDLDEQSHQPVLLYVEEPEAEPPPRVPNERDFCPACAALTWGGICADCDATKPANKRPTPQPGSAAQARPILGGVPL